MICGRKQYSVLFLPTWATSESEAIAHGSVRKTPLACSKMKNRKTPTSSVFFALLYTDSSNLAQVIVFSFTYRVISKPGVVVATALA